MHYIHVLGLYNSTTHQYQRQLDALDAPSSPAAQQIADLASTRTVFTAQLKRWFGKMTKVKSKYRPT